MRMRYLRSMAVGLLAPAIWSGAASAQITPNPTTFSVSGPVDFSQVGGGTINCNLNLSIVVNPGGMTGFVTSASLTPGHPFCSALATTSLPWPVNRITPSTMGRFEVSNIRIVGVASRCDTGRIIVTWDNWGTGFVETNGAMPGANPPIPYPNATCTIEGIVYQTSGAPVAVS